MAISEVVKEAKTKGPVLELIGEDDQVYYFRKPGKPEMNRYLAAAAKRKLAQASQNLVLELAIEPTRDQLMEKFDAKPGLMVAISNALQEAVGLNEEFEVKKL